MEKAELEEVIDKVTKEVLSNVKEAIKEHFSSQFDKQVKDKYASAGELDNLKSINRDLTKKVNDLEKTVDSQKDAIKELSKKVGEPVPSGSGSRIRKSWGTLLDEDEDE